MKKNLLGFFLMSLAFGLGFAACDNSEGSPDTDDDSDSDTDTDTDVDTDTAPDLLENFDDYKVDTPISTVTGDLVWELWPSGLDGLVTDEIAFSKPNSLEVVTDVDDVLMFNYASGSYKIDFKMFIAENLMGYYNFQAVYKGGEPGNVWAFEAFFYAGGVGNLSVGAEVVTDFSFTDNVWILISHEIDLDNDTAKLFVEDKLVFEWPYSASQGGGGGGTLDGIDFYGAPLPPGTLYWLDDVMVWEN